MRPVSAGIRYTTGTNPRGRPRATAGDTQLRPSGRANHGQRSPSAQSFSSVQCALGEELKKTATGDSRTGGDAAASTGLLCVRVVVLFTRGLDTDKGLASAGYMAGEEGISLGVPVLAEKTANNHGAFARRAVEVRRVGHRIVGASPERRRDCPLFTPRSTAGYVSGRKHTRNSFNSSFLWVRVS